MTLWIVGHFNDTGPLRLKAFHGGQFVLACSIVRAKQLYRDHAYRRQCEIGTVVAYAVPDMEGDARVLDVHTESMRAEVAQQEAGVGR